LAAKIPVVRIAVDPKGTAFLFGAAGRLQLSEEGTEEQSNCGPSAAIVLY